MKILDAIKNNIPDRLRKKLFAGFLLCQRGYGMLLLYSPLQSYKLTKIKKTQPLKLHIGCGKVKFEGWVNIDIQPSADLVIDLHRGIPFDDNSVDFIYCEHVLEPFSYENGNEILNEFHRCLKSRGRVRIAMPDLDYITQKYSADWKNQDWLTWPEYELINTKGQMINASFFPLLGVEPSGLLKKKFGLLKITHLF